MRIKQDTQEESKDVLVLVCGHNLSTKWVVEHCKALRSRFSAGTLLVKCQRPDCYATLGTQQLKQALGSFYDNFVAADSVTNVPQCFRPQDNAVSSVKRPNCSSECLLPTTIYYVPRVSKATHSSSPPLSTAKT